MKSAATFVRTLTVFSLLAFAGIRYTLGMN